MKDMDNYLQVVEDHPLAGRKSVDRYGSKLMVLAQTRFDFVCNRFQLRLRRAGAYHKKIRKRRDAVQIQHHNVLGLFVRGEFRAGFC